jgi:hypothetical protein
MGHAYATTTFVYLDAVGVEERLFAERMWEGRSIASFPLKEGDHH